MMKFGLVIVLLVLNASFVLGMDINILKKDIHEIIESKDATIGVSVMGTHPADTLSINGNRHLPMQSVYKYHLAVMVLHHVDQGKLNMEDTITITKQQLDNKLWSVIRKKYPNGAKLSLREVIKYTVAKSDNIGCDILFDLVGGPSEVEKLMHKSGIKDVAIRHKEAVMQSAWELQYLNWTTSNAAIKVLKTFYENDQQQLSSQSHTFLWEVMKQSWFGKMSLKTYLPENTVIAHKTGHSGKNEAGLTGAQNDIGIIFLPNGDYFYLSILISNSNEENNVNSKIIADIAKLSYDYFSNK